MCLLLLCALLLDGALACLGHQLELQLGLPLVELGLLLPLLLSLGRCERRKSGSEKMGSNVSH